MKALLAVLCGAALSSGFAAELLTNGNFASVQKDGRPAAWRLKAGGEARKNFSVEVTNGVVRCRVSPEAPANAGAWLYQEVPVKGHSSYRISAEACVSATLPQAEYASSITIYFLDEKNGWLGHAVLERLAFRSEKWKNAAKVPAAKWVACSHDVQTPADAVKMGVRLNFVGQGLSADWRNVSVEEQERTITRMLDELKLPADRPTDSVRVSADGVSYDVDWSDRDAVTEESATRSSMVLNGLWGFRPVAATNAWAYLKIPGETRANNASTVLYGNVAKYDHKSFDPVCLARTVDVPARLVGRRLSLAFDGSECLAYRVFWNGRALGDMDCDYGGTLSIPKDLVKAGRNDLMLLVQPRTSHGGGPAHLFYAGKPHPFTPVQSWYPCRLYDVTLLTSGDAPVFESVRITPSWEKKQLSVTFPKDGVAADLSYAATIKDKTGKVLLTAKGLSSAEKGNRREILIDWADPVVWTPETPNLLTLQLQARTAAGDLVDESLPLTFGFREVRVVGKKMYLNGHELRLRPRQSLIYNMVEDDDYLRRGFTYIKEMGFNTLLRRSDMGAVSGAFHGMGSIRLADEIGLFSVLYTPLHSVSSGQFFSKNAIDVSPELIRYIDDCLVSKFYNHPSFIAYGGFGTSPSLGDNLTFSNQPDCWGIDPIDTDERLAQAREKGLVNAFVRDRLQASLSLIRAVKALDPSRPYLTHYDSGSADGWGTFDYFNWTPMQEWEEWVANYPRHGVKPIGSWEHGNPYPQSFVSHAIPDGDGEPWVTEYAALWLGPRAYELETKDYLETTRKLYDKKRKVFGKSTHHGTGFIPYQPPAQAVWATFNARLYRSWRLQGMNMGIEPFGTAANYVKEETLRQGVNAHIADPAANLKTPGIKADYYRWCNKWPNEGFIPSTPPVPGAKPEGLNAYGEALYANNRPFLGFIAGDARNAIAKTHIFAPGETVRKQIALIHDGFGPLAGRVTGRVTLEGRQLAAIDLPFQFTSAATECRPFSFTVPASARGTLEKPLRGAIDVTFTAADGRELGRDRFAFSVLKPAAADSAGVVLYDPKGTGSFLADRVSRTVTTPAFADAKIVVIAPGAFTQDVFDSIPRNAAALVLEQETATLERLGLRVYPVRLREFWPDASFPVDAELLRDWRGGRPFALGESTKPLRKGYNNTTSTTGMVAPSVIDTPTRGNFTPLLHGGFDLAQTPLLETTLDGRRVIFSQLALTEENVKAEPAAQAIVSALLARLKTPAAERSAPAVWGDAALAHSLGAPRVAEGLPDSGVVLVTKALTPDEAVRVKAFVEKGGAAVLLPQDDAAYRALGVAFTRGKTSRFLIEGVAGLNAGNGHFRQELQTVLFGGSAIRERTLGRGMLVCVGFDPRALDVEQEPYLRFTYLRQMRTLAQLLTNVGAALDEPSATLVENLRQPAVNEPLTFAAVKIRPSEDAASLAWTAPRFDDGAWTAFDIAKAGTGLIDAQIRATFDAPARTVQAADLILDAGTFDDYDQIWLNGVKLGETTPANAEPDKAWRVRRKYPIPSGVLKEKGNVLAIHTWNRNGPTKGWKANVRGPFAVQDRLERPALYVLPARPADDPYLLHQW